MHPKADETNADQLLNVFSSPMEIDGQIHNKRKDCQSHFINILIFYKLGWIVQMVELVYNLKISLNSHSELIVDRYPFALSSILKLLF